MRLLLRMPHVFRHNSNQHPCQCNCKLLNPVTKCMYRTLCFTTVFYTNTLPLLANKSKGNQEDLMRDAMSH